VDKISKPFLLSIEPYLCGQDFIPLRGSSSFRTPVGVALSSPAIAFQERNSLAESLRGFYEGSARQTENNMSTKRKMTNLLFRPDRNFANLRYWLDIIEAPESVKRSVLESWKRAGRPPALKFAPYIAHVAKVHYFFYIAVAHQVITTRSSNQIDMEYFDYLPFARIFSSNDKLHREMYPALAEDWQIFMPFAS
jgi:hypothetical protein